MAGVAAAAASVVATAACESVPLLLLLGQKTLEITCVGVEHCDEDAADDAVTLAAAVGVADGHGVAAIAVAFGGASAVVADGGGAAGAVDAVVVAAVASERQPMCPANANHWERGGCLRITGSAAAYASAAYADGRVSSFACRPCRPCRAPPFRALERADLVTMVTDTSATIDDDEVGWRETEGIKTRRQWISAQKENR